MRGNLPRAARERVADAGAWWVALGWLAANARAIARAVLHANPLRLALRQPTMITAGFSVLMVLFFTAEIWDVASTVALVELAVFSLAALVVATAVLNRAVSLRSGAARSKRMAESTVVARAATMFSLFATMAVLYAAFFAFVLLAALTFFPHQLRSTWPTVKPATRLTDEVQIAMFLAAMGVLSGSRGGAAERKALIRHVLFVDEET